jgi:hypothetical protein
MRVRVLAAMTVAREFQAVYVWVVQTGGARRRLWQSARTIHAAFRRRTPRLSS